VWGNIFESVLGVDSVISGYAGGTVANPTYELVSTELTGHAESILVYYDPKVISYAELLKVFSLLRSHHRRSAGSRQGNSYRSVIFYQTKEEQALASRPKKILPRPFKIRLCQKLNHLMRSTEPKNITRIRQEKSELRIYTGNFYSTGKTLSENV